MKEEKKLPEGWVWTTTEQACSSVRDGTHDTPKYVVEGIPLITSKNLKETGLDFTIVQNIGLEDHRKISLRSGVEVGDILFAMIGTIGNPVVVKTERTFSIKNVGLFKKNESCLNPYYLKFWLSSWEFNGILEKRQLLKGTTQKFIPLGHLRILPLPLAPLAEQHRIVAAIEQQFSRLDVGVAALQSARARLKRYRAAVLKAAVEGKLTESWRAEHPTTEPASLLLERILKERRAKWEADLRAKGKDPAKVKYNEPAAPNVENLPELPEGWCWATVEAISTKVVDGVHKKPNYVDHGIPFVTVRNLTAGPSISFESLNYITHADHTEFSRRAHPEHGDILITKDGTLGVVRVIKTDIQFSIFVSVALIKPVLRGQYKSDYLGIALSSPQVQIQMVPKGSGLQHIHLEDLRSDCVPLSPLVEQEQIVAEVERHLSLISQLEKTVEANLKRAERLRQSILREAFAGRLVPQDPTDEPASVLLERIQSERNGLKNGAGLNNKKNRSIKVPEPVTLDVGEAEQAELWESVGN